jgi:hypothetical protein
MQKYASILFSVLLISVMSIGLSSCKKDEDEPEPVVNAKLSFSTDEMTVNEADGIIEIELKLDKPAEESFTVELSLDGDAVDEASVGENENFDFSVLGDDYLEVEFEKGATTAILELEMASDLAVEEVETIELEIDDVSGTLVDISTGEDEIVINLVQEDGLGIILAWGPADGGTYPDVDMDLFLWVEDETGELAVTNFSLGWSESTISPETLFFPTALLEDGEYGLSYNYYGGSADPMHFEVAFIDIVDGAIEAEEDFEIFSGDYTAANKNPWDVSEVSPILSQTFTKSGSTFTIDPNIFIADEGSRLGIKTLPSGYKRGSAVRMNQSFFEK